MGAAVNVRRSEAARQYTTDPPAYEKADIQGARPNRPETLGLAWVRASRM